MDNKVQFNLKNVHYAVHKPIEGGAISFEKPEAVPGAVTLTLNPQGSVTPFYADGIVYYNSVSNNGYSGDLEVARMPDKMQQDVWKMELDDNGVLLENANEEANSFALLYQIDGDVNEDFYCLYNCTGTRPGIGGTTNTETKTPQTRKTTISAVPLPDGKVMARTTGSTDAEVKKDWFNNVYQGVTQAATASEEPETNSET